MTVLYFALPGKWRAAMLLIASCWFYMAFIPAYILILAGTILVDYFSGLALEKLQGSPRRRLFLLASLGANIGVLAIFKYYGFFADNVAAISSALGLNYALPALKILLPVGLSFHTFQAMSYTIEVYRGHQKAERSLLIFALYVMFYPQLVAGPIERPQNILHQLHAVHPFDGRKVSEGLQLMLWGMFKKVVIADRLAVAVNAVYGAPRSHQGQELLLATYAFAIQIYCDFSGYSDIARGSARVMGIDLMQNFRTPYLSRSISEFWSRWHISLSTWFRDYLYIPLGGNRVSKARWRLNLLIVFLVSGLWHGANWTYVIWGALHGTYLIVATLTSQARERLADQLGFTRFPRLRAALQVFVTFQLVAFAWIFFRAESLSDALYIVRHLGSLHGRMSLGLAGQDMLVALALVLALVLLEARTPNPLEQMRSRPVWARWSFCYALLFSLLLLGQYTSKQFIYFQF